MNWKAEKVVIFGGGGFLGRKLAKRLVMENCASIRSFGRTAQPELERLGIEVLRGDIRDAAAVSSACRNANLAFHTAAKAGVWGTWRDYHGINVLGTKNVLASCRNAGITRLVYTSSPSIAYDPAQDSEGVDETAPWPSSYLAHYPRTKAMAEKLVCSENGAGLKTVSLRPHLIWGPGDPHLLPRIISRARAKRLIRVGEGKNIVDMSYVDNVAEAHIKAAEALSCGTCAEGKAYFISDDHPVNLWQWLDELLQHCELMSIRKSISYRNACLLGKCCELAYSLLRLPGEPPMTRFVAGQLAHSHYFDISAAKRDLGYAPLVPQDLAFSKTVEWLRSTLLGDKA
ncbi:MAG: hypothetical protein A2X49_12335 [Lentisphaerae bacterium GWF2_52_8]|nr:MAG: hypothetical protein A2X49_12335 [Lentisphaerae bacterium GWF2_52_8]